MTAANVRSRPSAQNRPIQILDASNQFYNYLDQLQAPETLLDCLRDREMALKSCAEARRVPYWHRPNPQNSLPTEPFRKALKEVKVATMTDGSAKIIRKARHPGKRFAMQQLFRAAGN